MKSEFRYLYILSLFMLMMVLPLSNGFAQFKPTQIPGLKLWLRGDSAVSLNGNKVTAWNDCSGGNNNALQGMDNYRPVLVNNVAVMNNHSVVSFDGVNDFLMSAAPISNINSSSMSVFIVANGNNVSGQGLGDIFFGINDYSNGIWINRLRTVESYSVLSQCLFSVSLQSQSGSLQNTGYDFKVFDYIKNLGVSSNIFINQVFQQTTTDAAQTSAFTNNNYYIGNGGFSYQGYYNGEFAEILVYASALNATDRTSVENYLLNKYAPAVNLGPDINIPYGMCDTVLNAGNRYVHYLWSTGDTTHSINVSQSGSYSVTVSNIFGMQTSDTVNVNMPEVVVHNFNFCLGDSVLINSNLSGTYSYLWMPGNITTPNIVIKNPGNYSLTVTDLNNCYRTKTFTATADSFAVKVSLGSDRKVCGQDIIGLVSGAQLAANYLWSDGSGNSFLSVNDPLGSHVSYSVTVTNNFGCSAIDSVRLFVNGVKPNVDFASDSVCFGTSTHFSNLSSSTPPSQINHYDWAFGDDSVSTVANPVHLFNNSGLYTVHLSALTDSGCMNELGKNIRVFPKPVAGFSPLNACSGASVAFIDKTQISGGTLKKWHWNFTQGNDTSDLQNPVYTFNTDGSFPVTLLATSDKGCRDTITQNMVIQKSPGVDFIYSNICEHRPVYFADNIQLQPWETIISYKWQFGDGDSAIISNPSHVFDSSGLYPVSLEVQSSSGCKVVFTKTMDAGGIPNVNFTYSNNCTFNLTQFADNSTISHGNINAWHWNFDGLGTSTIHNSSFIFPHTGNFNVVLTVNTNYNCPDSISLPVTIIAAPQAAFTVNPEYGIPPLLVSFTNNSISASSYHWSFGDNQTSVFNNPVHEYLEQGTYNVKMTAFNDIGCLDTTSAYVYVLPVKVDISVNNVQTSIVNNLLSVSCDITNEGTRKINNMDIAANFGNQSTIHEHWTDTLYEGETNHYSFTSSFEITQNNNISFVCINATLPGLTDENPENNLACSALTTEFTMMDTYPNPVIGKVHFAFILPFADDVSIEIINSSGAVVKQISQPGSDGFNFITSDISNLNSGVYTIRLIFKDKIARVKFVKL